LSGFVYIIECQGLYKVGMTRGQPHKRLKELQTGQPFKLTLMVSYRTADPLKVEQRMHSLLKSKHFRGEWFRADLEEIVRAYNAVTGSKGSMVLAHAKFMRATGVASAIWARLWRTGRDALMVIGALSLFYASLVLMTAAIS